MKYHTRSHSGGFTLMELMTVIVIIGLLATIIFAALQQSRARGRDAHRVQTLKEIQKAVELYRADYAGFPPRGAARSGSATNVCANGTRGDASWCSLMADLAPYMRGEVRDPSGDTQTTYRFYYDSDLGDAYQTYGLMSILETNAYDELANEDGGVYCPPGGPCNQPTVRGYELGQQPQACQNLGQTNWWSSGTNVCP